MFQFWRDRPLGFDKSSVGNYHMVNLFNRLFVSRRTLQQYGALCYRMRKSHLEIALVTSRGTGRFVIPKGWPEPGFQPFEAAAKEAEEEAGLIGEIAQTAIGSYGYLKRLHLFASITCRVSVFPLRVTDELASWDEGAERQRVWMSPQQAASSVAEHELEQIILEFERDFGSA